MIEVKAKKMEGGFLVPESSEYPANKWQLFRQRYFPFWLLRVFPIKTVTVKWAEILKNQLAEEKIKKDWVDILNKEALKMDRLFMKK